MDTITAEVPRAFQPLLVPSRYKGAYGGRGGAKSHFFGEQCILRCYAKPTRFACIREVQQTIRDSVKQLLIDKIQKFNLGNFFVVRDGYIEGANGSYIIFKGMQNYNAENIKSLEDFDVAWVEEAQSLSARSLRLLRPTIRKEGSEIWASWNPRHDTDAIDVFFRGGTQRAGAISVNVNWYDNPWFPEVLRQDMEDDYAEDPEMAEHVWGGGYEIITERAYYARHMAQAEKEGRVGYFPYDPTRPVITTWDIGVDDYTAIWFLQEDGVRVWVIDYYEVSGDGAQQVVEASLPELNPDEDKKQAALVEAERDAQFRYGRHFLPHDVRNREWGSGAKSRYETLRGLGVKPINVGVRQGPVERVNATRALFPVLHFNDTRRVRKGIARLRRYSRKWNSQMETFTGVLHDDNSHGADAIGEFAVNCGIRPKPQKQDDKNEPRLLQDGVTINDLWNQERGRKRI